MVKNTRKGCGRKSIYRHFSVRREKVLEIVELLREIPEKVPFDVIKENFVGLYSWYWRACNEGRNIIGFDKQYYNLNQGETIFSLMLRETGIENIYEPELTPEERERWVYLDFNNVKHRMLEAYILITKFREDEKRKYPPSLLNHGRRTARRLFEWYNENVNSMARAEAGVVGYDGNNYTIKEGETKFAFMARETGLVRFLNDEEKSLLGCLED